MRGAAADPAWAAADKMSGVPRGHIPGPPNVPLRRALWSPLDGIWGILKGSWDVCSEFPIRWLYGIL